MSFCPHQSYVGKMEARNDASKELLYSDDKVL